MYGSLTATVTSMAREVRDGQIRVELHLTPDAASQVPLQHGLPGTVEVEIERLAPAALVLRVAGQRLGVSARAVDAGNSRGGSPQCRC